MANSVTMLRQTALSATTTTPWTHTSGAHSALFHLSWAGAGTPVGAFTLECSNDPRCETELLTYVTPANSTAKKVDVTASIPADAVVGTGLSVSGGGDGSTIITMDNPPEYVRIVYTRSSGGSAASVANIWLNLTGAR